MTLYYLPNKHTARPNTDWPEDWPAQTLELPAGKSPPLGFIETTTAALDELKQSLETERGIIAAREAAKTMYLEATTATFEELPLKLPSMIFAVIESVAPTDEQRQAIVLGMGPFVALMQSGYVQLAVSKFNQSSAPVGVPVSMWADIIGRVNEVMIRNSEE